MVILRSLLRAALWGALCSAVLWADVSAKAQGPAHTAGNPFLHPLFSDNAVLQRDRPLPVWGWTKPGTTVAVTLDDSRKQTAVAAADGRWTVTLAPHPAGGPHSLSVSDPETGDSATRSNLAFGDVWLCGGQSNMAFDIRGTNNADAERAAADYPDIRLLRVPNAIIAAPRESFDGAVWHVCSPQTILEFSAVGYYFGRDLQHALKVPIGLIDSTWAGTVGQAWVSGPALATMTDFKPAVESLSFSASTPGTYAEQKLVWWRHDPGTVAHQEAPEFNDAAWQAMTLPGAWEDKGFPNFDGVMWFRRTVDVPTGWAGRDLRLDLGNVDDQDATYWNGALVGATDAVQQERHYTVPGAQVKAGRNVLAVRVLDTGGGGGLLGPALSMKSGTETVSLGGAWKAHPGPALHSLPPVPQQLTDPDTPTSLFNGKIAPLVPAQIKGVIWYQGESNADHSEQAVQYRTLLPLLINDWRAHFGAHLPFYIVQLANFRKPQDQPMSSDVWPLMREAQLQTSQRLPDAPLVVTSDLGEVDNVHFHNKQELGRRLELSALNHTYGVPVESSGPTLKSAKAAAGVIRLTFDHAQGLNLKGDVGHVFVVAGADKKFQWATPQIAGRVVTLRSAAVPAPLYARFGWSDNPRASVYNAAGLPASPFRTDQDYVQTQGPAKDQVEAVYNAWNEAFLAQSDGTAYYTTTRHGSVPEGTWVGALDVEMAEDVCLRTRTPAQMQLLNALLRTFLAQNDFVWSQDTWNDDLAWMTLAMLHGYQITGNATFLKKAVSAWNIAYDRGWDTKYGGGGIWENMDNFVHGDGRADKCSLSNNPFVTAGVALYQITGDAAYLTKSEAIYAWVRANLFSTTTGQVNEGVKWPIGNPAGGFLENSDNVYNSGSFLEAADTLFRVTGKAQYYQDARLAANHIVDHMLVLHDGGRYQTQWAYRFVKGLSEFATENHLWPQYLPWMLRNAQAAWNARDSSGLTWNDWTKPTDDPKIDANETSSAVAVWQWLPPPRPLVPSGRYEVVNAASRLPLKVAGSSLAAGAPVAQGKSQGGAGVLWTFVPTGGGYCQIKNVKSGLVAGVAADSVQSGAKIVQRPAQGFHRGSDEWQPIQNADGTYSFYNLNSLQALEDPNGAAAPGTPMDQGFADGSPAQRFTLIAQNVSGGTGQTQQKQTRPKGMDSTLRIERHFAGHH